MRYGGNTSCVEVIAGGHRIVLDSGTGVRDLGKAFVRDDVRDFYLLFTHTHWDHINGIPFFVPAYMADRSIRIMAGHLKDAGGIRSVLSGQMHSPMFPVPMDSMRSKMTFEDFYPGDALTLYPDLRVRTAPLNHPNGAVGYRFEYGGRVFCYVTDTEHVPGTLDRNILGLIEGADLVAYDAMYTEDEFPAKVTWGHSTWNEGVKLCREAGAARLALFHHEPDHDDTFMAKLEAEAKEEWPHVFAARDGLELDVG